MRDDEIHRCETVVNHDVYLIGKFVGDREWHVATERCCSTFCLLNYDMPVLILSPQTPDKPNNNFYDIYAQLKVN